MPIDEAVIETTVTQLIAKLKIKGDEIDDIRSILANLESVKQTDKRVRNQTGGFDIIKEDPMDTSTNKKMSVARRQLIYDENLTRAQAVLA